MDYFHKAELFGRIKLNSGNMAILASFDSSVINAHIKEETSWLIRNWLIRSANCRSHYDQLSN